MTNECLQNNETDSKRLSPPDDCSRMSLKDGDCNCVWIENQDLADQPCGGCENDVRLYRDDPIHWRDKHWHLRCAFERARTELVNGNNTENKSVLEEF